jgi:tetratricopeptide (TPR) repeat protein
VRRVWVMLLLAGVLRAQAQDPRVAQASADVKAGRAEAALAKLNRVLDAKPAAAVEGQARLELAHIYQQQGRWLDAAAQFTRLRALAPNDPEYAYQLGVAHRQASRAALVQMQTSAPSAARTKQLAAEQLIVTGKTGKAIRLYQEAIQADPGLRGSHLGLALLYAQSGRRSEALAETEAELKIAPESALATQIRRSLEAGAR